MLRAVPSSRLPRRALKTTGGDNWRRPLAKVLLPSMGLERQHPGGRGTAAPAPEQGRANLLGSLAAWVLLTQPQRCWELPTTITVAAGGSEGQGPVPGRSQLGVSETQGLHGTAQALAHPANSQQAVPDHDAGAGAARGGHGRQALPLVLLWVEGLCRLQDGRLVSWKHKLRHWVAREAPAGIPHLLWDSAHALDLTPLWGLFFLLPQASQGQDFSAL